MIIPAMTAINTNVSKIRIFRDSRSVPNIIGNGPMRIIPPPLTFSVFSAPRNANRINATMIMAMPKNIRANPAYVNRLMGSIPLKIMSVALDKLS